MSKRFLRSVAVVLGSVTALAWSRSASAQEWLKDRKIGEGQGYQVGDLDIHPGIAGEIGYDSNYFLRSEATANPPVNVVNGAPSAEPVGTGMIRITPSVSIVTSGGATAAETGTAAAAPQKVTLSAALAATYREFLSNQESLRKQRNVSGNARFDVNILPGRPWGATVFATYDRTIQPQVLSDPNLSFNRDDLGAGFELVAQPNSGTLDWRVGYQFHTTLFEESEGQVFNNLSHSISSRGRWKFRPRTALLFDGALSFRTYTDASQATTKLHDAQPVRARVGINGLITPRLALLAMAGWASTFFNTSNGRDPTAQQYDSIIGQAELKFFPGGNAADDPTKASLLLSSVSLGFLRDYQASYLGDFYGVDRGYLKAAYFFAGRALVSLEGGVGTIEYPTIYFNNGVTQSSPFTDIRADATLFGEYRVVPSVGINATLRYTENFSNTQLPATPNDVNPGPGGQKNIYDMSWRRFEAFLGARWFM